MGEYDDPKAWQLIKEGRTKGCFQIESALCKAWCKKILPESIDHLSAVISLVRPGCVSKDTLITIKYYPKKDDTNCWSYKKISIETLFNRFQKDKKKIQISCYDEKNHKIINNNIVNVIYSGKKNTYEIKYRRQYWRCRKRKLKNRLKCTLDHPLYVFGKGWVELEKIKIGDRILVVSRRQDDSPIAFKQACFDNYEYKCLFCDWQDGSLDVNHLVGNRKTNNHPDNLCFLCPNHHRMYSEGTISKEDVLKIRDNFKLPQNPRLSWETFEGYDFVGNEDTYDITMEAPHHNFIANNIVVHNCLEAVMDDKNMPTHYAHRKNGMDEVTYKYECLRPSLETTYGVLVYQEQIMQMVRDIAGFTLQEADALRKAAGKKLPEEMAKVKKLFLDGCAKLGIVKPEEAEEIFEWIEKSQRYLFVKAHGVAYAILGYKTAYLKAHYPLEFYTGWLRHAHEKMDPLLEKAELVSDAKMAGIEVCVPDIRDLKSTFYIKDEKIYFGLGNVKSVGESQTNKIANALAQSNLADITWYQFLKDHSDKINKTAIVNLISVGAFDFIGQSRNEMIYQYEIFNKLTNTEKAWLKGEVKERKLIKEDVMIEVNENEHEETMWIESSMGDEEGIKEYQEYCEEKDPKYKKAKQTRFETQTVVKPRGDTTLDQALINLAKIKSEGGGCANKNRVAEVQDLVKVVLNPPYSLSDTPGWIAEKEKNLLGISITFHSVDDCDTETANCTCKDFLEGYNGNSINIAVELNRVAEYVTTKGKNPGQLMSFLTGSDSTGQLDSITCFPAEYATFKELLVEGNTVLLSGSRSKQNSLVVKVVTQL